MQKPKVKIKNNWPFGDAPFPLGLPVLIEYNDDYGWIIEDLNYDEYEIQNIIYPDERPNKVIDFDLAAELAGQREIWLFPQKS